MDTSNNAGGNKLWRQCLRDTDVLDGEFTEFIGVIVSSVVHYPSQSAAEAIARFFKALAEGDRAVADQVLRSWGIR